MTGSEMKATIETAMKLAAGIADTQMTPEQLIGLAETGDRDVEVLLLSGKVGEPDIDEFDAGAVAPVLRDELGLDRRVVVFGSQGRILRRKGYVEMIRAARLGNELPLLVGVGGGSPLLDDSAVRDRVVPVHWLSAVDVRQHVFQLGVKHRRVRRVSPDRDDVRVPVTGRIPVRVSAGEGDPICLAVLRFDRRNSKIDPAASSKKLVWLLC